ncbi:DNA polymerase III subunit delta [Motiliproteus sp. MSK22-1]|uniref:DNA polymerase III subunit delta n=1 Tax=Motiliproteus sp. MSK22-1 TaxID=1897630 RepID=UPI000978AA5A|nr:DNA polymerase III subunit delta [Motiliproteus sp. MSK22-1]OMH33719.1 DNA polymerase III subunit delta [Motiliproteus sp. MSK22-1]
MKLPPEQLGTHLKQRKAGLLPVYLLSGDEPLLVQEAGDQLRQTARALGFDEREVMHADNSFQWEELLDRTSSLSLFSEKLLIELHIPNGKPGPKGTEILNLCLQSPSPDTLILIFCPKLDANTQKSKWYKTVDKAGATLAFWPVEIERLPAWIQNRFQRANIQITADAVQLLTERVEGNLLAASQEIEKLQLLYPEQPITEEEIISSVADNSRYDLFTLADTALRGDSNRCLKILQGLKSEGTDATLILWALSRDLRTLVSLNHESGSGSLSEAQFKKHRIWGKRKGLINKALRRLSTKRLTSLLQRCSEVDQAIKGVKHQSPWILLTDITIEMAGGIR